MIVNPSTSSTFVRSAVLNSCTVAKPSRSKHFAVIATRSGPGDTTNPFVPSPGQIRYASLRDTINIPPNGSVIIRFRVAPELGKYVFHCHILPHEDAGMMMGVLAIPSPFDRRVALGTQPGQPSAVFVKNGKGGSVGRINVGSP